MENLSELFDETGELMNEVVNLNECLFKALESKLMNCEDCFCILPLAELTKNKLQELQDKYITLSDQHLHVN